MPVMGWVKDQKIDAVTAEARRATEEGRTFFTPMLNTPLTQHKMSGSVSGWAEMIEAIEQQGWVLVDWAVANDSKDRPQAYPLFRRRGAA